MIAPSCLFPKPYTLDLYTFIHGKSPKHPIVLVSLVPLVAQGLQQIETLASFYLISNCIYAFPLTASKSVTSSQWKQEGARLKLESRKTSRKCPFVSLQAALIPSCFPLLIFVPVCPLNTALRDGKYTKHGCHIVLWEESTQSHLERPKHVGQRCCVCVCVSCKPVYLNLSFPSCSTFILQASFIGLVSKLCVCYYSF